MRRLLRQLTAPRFLGAAFCALGLALLIPDSLVAAALGVELVATGFWVWARAAADAREQRARWAWLRRPATALWLAVAIHTAQPGLTHAPAFPASGALELLRWLEAIAVLWAGLELMAALPLVRPYSDLPGPLLTMRPWLPVMLPAAGFMVLWRQSVHWTGVEQVGQAAAPLLVVTAVLGALRAFARRKWTASLRWLAVTDCALAGLLVPMRVVSAESNLLLWIGVSGAHASLLAGELRGAVTRRGHAITRLWQAAGWSAIAAVSFPSLVAAQRGGRFHLLTFAGVAFTTALASWITVGRLNAARERRLVMRPDPALTVSQVGALMVLSIGPLALGLAWWSGFEPSALRALVAIVPALLGGGAALAADRGAGQPLWQQLKRVGDLAPEAASGAYRLVVGIERALIGGVARVTMAATSALHDLHTGDAQEYLLFLVGLGVLALVLPLLQ